MNDEAMKMARRIAAETKFGAAPEQILRGDWDNSPVVRAALAAIIETRDRDAALAENYFGPRNALRSCGSNICRAIRSGQQFRENEK